MLSVKIKNTELCLDFSFFAALAIFTFFDSSGLGSISLVMCMLHELAHLLIMLLMDVIPNRVKFYGAGISITAQSLEYRSGKVRFAVYSAGCVLNFILAAGFWLIGNGIFSAINLCIGMLNLFPIGELDGARILGLIIESHFEPAHSDRIRKICGFAGAVICAVILAAIGGKVSVSALISVAYLLVLCALRSE